MSFLVTVRIAAVALLRNKMRSILTALGIIIGVASVIAMMAIGEGAKRALEEQFTAMGTDRLMLQPGSTRIGGVRGGAGTMPTLTWDDLRAIQTEVPTVMAAAPSLRIDASIVAEQQNWTTRISGTTPDYFRIRKWPMNSGVAFGESDVDARSNVVILGQTVVGKLYGPNADPVGQVVRIKGVPFRVIGVAAAKGQSPTGTDYDDAAFVPITTFSAKIDGGGMKSHIPGVIMIAATSPATVSRAEQDITTLLRQRHRLRDEDADDFSIRNFAEAAGAQLEGTKTMTTLLASVAAVSLLVGGIGIMNIMLVSVTERTREIGIRLAVGAKPRHILSQFLTEALTLSIAGGLLGVAIGVYAAHTLASRFGWPLLVRVDIVGIAVGVSVLVGVVFGLYPARKAARLDPIAALRAE